MCWEVGLWVEQLERKGEKGGWAEQCPTEGGTDEVREKWRETRRVREARTQRTEARSFPYPETAIEGYNVHT